MAKLTLNDLYTRTINQSGADEDKYTSAIFLQDVNILVQDIWSEVVRQKKGSGNWDIWTTDIVINQNEYTGPKSNSIDVWVQYIEDISIIFWAETYETTWALKYIPVKQADIEQISNWEYYGSYQPKTQPIYFQRDWSVFIAPTPLEWWKVKITWVRSIASWDWTLSTEEDATKLPLFILETIVAWCVWKASTYKRIPLNEIIALKNDYMQEKELSISKIASPWVFFNVFPD